MSDMTHDEFLNLLSELELAGDGDERDWRQQLPEEAARHAEGCADCSRAAEALALLARDENALYDEPPDSYWESFDERLSARLESAGRPAPVRPVPARRALPTTLKLAAAVLAALVLGALALRGLDGGAARQARGGGESAPGAEELSADELLAAWAGESELPAAETALAVPAEEEFPSALGAPLEALHEELAAELDDAQAAELARLLREEIES